MRSRPTRGSSIRPVTAGCPRSEDRTLNEKPSSPKQPREAVRAAAGALGPRIGGVAFAEIVRRLERAGGGAVHGGPGQVGREPVLFRSTPSLGFPPSDVTALRPRAAADDWPVELDLAFLGLYGPSSPLPTHWTESVLFGDNDEAVANLRDALDLFGHVLVGLHHRIWRYGRLHLDFDGTARDLASLALLRLAGLDAEDADAPLDPLRLLPLVGLLAQHARSASTIERAIGLYFGQPVRIEEWVRRDAVIPDDSSFCLGRPAAVLGASLLLGATVPDRGTTVTVTLGPLDAASFASFLPGAPVRAEFDALLSALIRETLFCRVVLALADGEPGSFMLGTGRLGWTTWSGNARERRCEPRTGGGAEAA